MCSAVGARRCHPSCGPVARRHSQALSLASLSRDVCQEMMHHLCTASSAANQALGWLRHAGHASPTSPLSPATPRPSTDLPNPGKGWVSGTIAVPDQGCRGLSAAACSACLATKSPNECMACAGDQRAKLAGPGTYVAKKGSDTQRGCAICSGVAPKAEREM